MFRPLARSHRRPPRRGTAILITCFFLITIMMVTGLALVMYAAKEKAAALAYQDAVASPAKVSPDPTNAVNQFLSGLIYDTDNDGAALQNALRGHSIARGMYGSNPTGQAGWTGATTPWNGVGLFFEDGNGFVSDGTNPYTALTGIADAAQRDRRRFVNHNALVLSGKPFVLDPEWTGNRGAVASGTLPAFDASRANKSYVSKAAGYTYPDLKSFFLAARDPHTGEVLVPSFHRDWLFRDPNRPGTESPLAPTNANWTNEVGKLLTLRPRPAEHPNFPRVPPNADGTYTGDVQNGPGSYVRNAAGQFVAKNDSLWMHIGLPPITLPDGRRVQPLVAPLILPLDGSFDLSTHGNRLNGTAHGSYGGYGPWEVSIDRSTANATDAQALMNRRTASQSAAFAPFTSPVPQPPGVPQPLPAYAPVAWNNTLAATFALPDPTSASLRGLPTWSAEFENTNAAVAGHPAGYNRNEFGPRNSTTTPPSPVYPYTDLKRFSLRYAFSPDWYNQAFAAQDARDTFSPVQGTSPYQYFPAPGQAEPLSAGKVSYRLDPAHTRRLLFTPKASSLDRPALAPTFLNRDATALSLAAGATKPGPLFATPVAYPNPQARGALTDFAADNQWFNPLAALGSVDLNRPLADYRNDTATPLATANMGNATVADADRQALARDIFVRLIVATGAAAQVDAAGTVTLPDPVTRQIGTSGPTATPEQYNALRYLAQLAVNIVDDLDNDDVSTTFVWNATGTPDYTQPTEIGSRVVFGVEKPRLVLNEVYGEITNAPTDPVVDPNMDGMGPLPLDPMANAHVKFWAELVNPTSAPHGAGNGVLGNGAVALNAYQIQLSRANRATGVMAAQAGDLASYLSNPANTAGRLGDPAAATPLQPDATFTLAPAAPRPTSVSPNDVSLGAQQYAPNQADLPAGGFVLVGPPQAEKMNSKEFTPPNTGLWAQANKVESPAPGAATTSTGMGYTFTMPEAATLSTREFKRHVVLLRRLANPYLPVNDPTVTAPAYNAAQPLNPYVTVDVMDYVPAFDAVHRAKDGRTDRGEWDMTNNPNGFDPVANRFSVGKMQPLAGLSVAALTDGKGTTGGYNVYNGNNMYTVNSTLTASMVRDQTAVPTPPAMGVANPNEPKNTFGRHNGSTGTVPGATTVNTTATPPTLSDTIMLPFDWMPHKDRPLETAGDLFTVRDCPPHRLTTEFAQPAAAAALNYNASYAAWAGHNGGLERALELLTVKSPAVGVAHGGRTGGKLNANVIQDQRIVQGVWDPQASNKFDLNFVNNTVWSGWLNARSPLLTGAQQRYSADGTTTVTVPGTFGQVADLGGTERPFAPFGAPVAAAGGFAYTSVSPGNDGDTILRRSAPTADPYLYQTAEAHPYTRTEPLRKVMNNLTTVSHSFVVYLTIGYFDVTFTTPAGYPTNVNGGQVPQFGAEVYDQIPGDMRQKFIAVIDMSNMALQAGANQPATGQPFFTALTATARPGANATTPVALTLASGGGDGTNFSIPADGQTVTFQATNPPTQLVVGYGAEQQLVTVDAVGPRAAGGSYPSGLTANQIGVTNLTRTAWGGTVVSNVRPGYVGPQPSFNINSAAYKPVVPYVERLR